MPLLSDITVNRKIFDPSSISLATLAFNKEIQNKMGAIPRWYEIGAGPYRALRASGRSSFPAPVHLPSAKSFALPSHDPHDPRRTIPCRVLQPQNGKPQGVFMHIHGGGWVLNDEKSSDVYLQIVADTCGLLCISIGYRLAPEDPYPAAVDDCYRAAEWLVDNAQAEFGAPLAFIGGESAGANLTILTMLHLLHSPVSRYAKFRFSGLLCHYGTYSLQWLASLKNCKKDPPLVIDEDIMTHFREAYLPGLTADELVSPQISPLYADLAGTDLPPAFFTCGTEDCLLDDSVFMSVKWMIAGGDAVIRIYPGSPHGYIMFAEEAHENVKQAMRDVQSFVRARMTAAAHESSKSSMASGGGEARSTL